MLKIFSRFHRTLSFICSQDSIANGALVIARLPLNWQPAPGPSRSAGRPITESDGRCQWHDHDAHEFRPARRAPIHGRWSPGRGPGPARHWHGHRADSDCQWPSHGGTRCRRAGAAKWPGPACGSVTPVTVQVLTRTQARPGRIPGGLGLGDSGFRAEPNGDSLAGCQ